MRIKRFNSFSSFLLSRNLNEGFANGTQKQQQKQQQQQQIEISVNVNKQLWGQVFSFILDKQYKVESSIEKEVVTFYCSTTVSRSNNLCPTITHLEFGGYTKVS